VEEAVSDVLKLQAVKDDHFAYVRGSDIAGLSAPWTHTEYGPEIGEKASTVETEVRSVHLRGGGVFTVRNEPEVVATVLNALHAATGPWPVAIANVGDIVREAAAVAQQLEAESTT
jgi:hypothetical protein